MAQNNKRMNLQKVLNQTDEIRKDFFEQKRGLFRYFPPVLLTKILFPPP